MSLKMWLLHGGYEAELLFEADIQGGPFTHSEVFVLLDLVSGWKFDEEIYLLLFLESLTGCFGFDC